MTDVFKIGFEFDTPLGPRSLAVDVEDVPTRLAELVPVAHLVTDTYLEASIARERQQGRELSCTAGCGTCCRQYVAISIPEALYVAEMLDQLPEPRRQLYASRIKAAAERLEQAGMLQRALDPTTDPEGIPTLPREYFHLGIPCPFLTDESCSIYPHRPTPCRDHNITSPAERCRDPYEHQLAKVPSPLPLSSVLARLTTRLGGGPPTLLPLSLVTMATAQYRDLDRQTWPGAALVRDLLTALGGEAD